MASLEHLDFLLGDALERLVEATDETRGLERIEKKPFIMGIGRIVSELWALREQLYKIDPEIKRDFVVEYEKDKVRFERLNKLYRDAFKQEKNGNVKLANDLYNKLYSISQSGYFRLIAEAGLFRMRVNKTGRD